MYQAHNRFPQPHWYGVRRRRRRRRRRYQIVLEL
jgi:hypothetical protein